MQVSKAILAAVAAIFAGSVHAAPLYCTTNVTHNPLLGETSVTIDTKGGQLQASLVMSGGIAKFVTAPKVINVTAKNFGPEVVVYSNDAEGFAMTVNFQPIAGQIRGSLKESAFGAPITSPVVCVQALN